MFSEKNANWPPSAHRQRTLDYIDELEAEIFRLRASATTAVSSDVAQPHCNQPPQTALKIITNINVNVLIQSFNGQIAPGIFTCVYPGATGPSNMDGDLANDVSCECCNFFAYIHILCHVSIQVRLTFFFFGALSLFIAFNTT